MIEEVSVRRVGANEAAARVEALADVLLDCVEGGASVGFMRPLGREKAVAFWRRVADSVTRGERVLLVAEDGQGQLLGTMQLPQEGEEPGRPGVSPPALGVIEQEPKKGHQLRLDGAGLLSRTFALDVFACARCGGRRRVLAHPTASDGVGAIVEH